MSEGHEPRGFLTETESEVLAGETDAGPDEEVIYQRVQDRLAAALEDCLLLYPTLRQADVEAVFCPEDDSDQGVGRAGTQAALALLVFGMLLDDDMLETRLTDAIKYAGLAFGEEITVDLDLRRGPIPTVEQLAARCETCGLSPSDYVLYEQLRWGSDADPERLAALSQQLGFDTTADQIREERADLQRFARFPQTAVTGVDVRTEPEDTTSSQE